MARVVWLLVICCLLEGLCCTRATLSKSDKKKRKSKLTDEFTGILTGRRLDPEVFATAHKKQFEKTSEQVELPVVTVLERGLVSENVKWKDVVNNHQAYSQAHLKTPKFEGGPVLGYVTPWNSHGYDVAKLHGAKFTYVSPVWLQLVPRHGSTVNIQGKHDVDKGWMDDVHSGNKAVKIVPRLLFEGWTANALIGLFRSEEQVRSMSGIVAAYLKGEGFDGVVVEIWSQLGGHYKAELTDMLVVLSEILHNEGLELILVIPSSLRGSMFDHNDFNNLVRHVDFFSLMTYDYSDPSNPGPGPVAPLPWVKHCVESLVPDPSSQRQKILMGLNFYGYQYSTSVQAVVGTTFIELLSKHKPKFHWDQPNQEHYIQFRVGSVQHTLYFPTLQSISARLQLAEELGTGIAIWEIGQGLDYFYDLL